MRFYANKELGKWIKKLDINYNIGTNHRLIILVEHLPIEVNRGIKTLDPISHSGADCAFFLTSLARFTARTGGDKRNHQPQPEENFLR